jgi:hypothetical protein
LTFGIQIGLFNKSSKEVKEEKIMAIYLLYDCNDWRNQSSMDATSPIAVSTSKKEFDVMLAKDLVEDAKYLSDENMRIFLTFEKKEGGLYAEETLSEIYDVYDGQRIQNKHIVVLEEGYKVN